ncbi:Piso0_003103 [Millerozyma farinosa CBS 7064]|uniref:Protein CFT1 n=1 Tax=Pichia sorbitophila (strain ATCC MYA-4447 / BCRC 22081 / CBS 7064 / NBRC 10061 / NRRL Y-12695) TaxID=559304 RepID=G8YH70_PICSO|nr:Piso0_003103 [Millerozyma farinosa CBS 7064]CCE80772.1 Piso0_003103 [Millerozyma farinosa CBS 7064]
MNVYNEFIEPTRISQAVSCNFISSSRRHLVVGKSTLLQVFDIVQSNKKSKEYKLKLVEQFKLHGLITDLKAVRTVENPDLDYLLVSTKSAKMSLVKWDHHENSISTVSLHYYENSIQSSTYEKLTTTELIMEPNNTCACLRFKNLLTFLPFEMPDEDDEEDGYENVDGASGSRGKHDNKATQQDENQALFYSSFVIDAQNLDSRIGNVIDMKFLYNYKEPTLAIISSKNHTWTGLLPLTKDNISFIVLSLDLVTKTSTTVLKIDNLPFDIDTIVPLPKPLNGTLLIGCNEIIHVDHGGITRRLAVNQFTSSITSSIKNYRDQSELNLKLENCCVKPIPNDHRVFLILKNGDFYYINFAIDGKTIKNFYLEKVNSINQNEIGISYPEDVVHLDNNLMFICNKNGNSPLIELKFSESKDNQNAEQQKDTEMQDTENGTTDKNDNDDDDDIYEDDEDNEKVLIKNSVIEFTKHDELINNGPVSSFTFGYYSTDQFKSSLPNPNFKEVSIISNSGSHSQSNLNIITPGIQPIIKSSLSFSQINRMWNIANAYLITSDDINFKSEIFQIHKSFARLNSRDFINNELTIGMHEISKGQYFVQVTPRKIIVYNKKFKKIISFKDELKKYKNDDIIHSTFADEFLMVFFASGEVVIYSINTYAENYERINIPKILNDTLITTGYITSSNLLNAVSKDVNLLINKNRGHKRKHGSSSSNTSAQSQDLGPKSKTFILVTGDNRIVAFSRFHNERCYQLNDVDKFTDCLSLGFFDPKDSYPDPFIKNIVFNELGDEHSKDEYLTILTIGGEVIIYKLFFDGDNFKFIKEKDLKITGAPDNAYPLGTTLERRLVYVPNVNGYSSIFVTGIIPYFITKTVHSVPRIFRFTKLPAVSFSSYSDSNIKNGFIYLDNSKNARMCEIPLDFNYENNWPIKKIQMPETVKAIAYHELSNTFVVSSYEEIPYDCLDEEGKPIVGIDKSKPPAESYKGYLRLISPYNWSVIDTIVLADNEIGMNVLSMVLDVGSSTKKFKSKKELIVLGSGKYRIEDLSSNGSFKIFEIIDIIPEPGKPETNHKFKEVHIEDTRGAVTSICEVSGRLLVTQGQKIIIRDLQDDGVVPVAFLDTAVYVSEAKSFGNLILLGDSLKSVWLAGFDAEPFRMILLSKDIQTLDVSCADFIVKDEEIFILFADNNNVLHVVKFDPEDPLSSNGQRLVHKTSFNINSAATCFRTIPKNEENYPSLTTSFQSIGSTIDGSFFTVFPINESTYRRMYILQQQLTDKEFHICGLNPRLNRFGGLNETNSDANSKPMLEYDVIKKFVNLNSDRKKNFASKIGSKNSYQDIWRDLIEFESVLKNM